MSTTAASAVTSAREAGRKLSAAGTPAMHHQNAQHKSRASTGNGSTTRNVHTARQTYLDKFILEDVGERVDRVEQLRVVLRLLQVAHVRRELVAQARRVCARAHTNDRQGRTGQWRCWVQGSQATKRVAAGSSSTPAKQHPRSAATTTASARASEGAEARQVPHREKHQRKSVPAAFSGACTTTCVVTVARVRSWSHTATPTTSCAQCKRHGIRE